MALPLLSYANNTTTVNQVNSHVSINDDVDYVITSDTPFTDEGIVDITNTEHAVVILSRLKPSKAASWLSHVRINGAQASNNVNCQVKMYNIGSIILPYGNDIKPLTVFSGKDFTGESVNDFGLENSGGFMNTLSEEKLNNRIQSFKLKRGYMVTFSTLPRGRGYSRCFIAANADLEIAQLPNVLAGRISSYRVFKWYDSSKSGIANDTRLDPCSKLNVTGCYSFGLGESRAPDTECVPHHIYEDWPSAGACGGVTYSPHLKTNNEPGNSVDDHPQTVDEILANWENLMATGMRLCSPSSHDGSLNHLRAFLDSIDARGWRCDIIDLHCYWVEGSFNSIKSSWVDKYQRPIWISEWVWGASWNNNGIFGIATGSNRDNPTQSQLQQNKTGVQNICTKLNSWDYIERYFYWNSEANCSKLYLSNGTLTPAGEYYAAMNPGVGYNGKYNFIPKSPRQYGISNYKMTTEGSNITLSWSDRNGEYNQMMEVQRKLNGGQWETIQVVEQKETAANYSVTFTDVPEGTSFRIHIIDMNGTDHYTNDDLAVGDVMTTTEGKEMFLGGNLIANSDFALGTTGWNNGTGAEISQPFFQVVPTGGYQGGAYLQAYGSGGVNDAASLKKIIDIQPHKQYVFSVALRNAGSYVKASLTSDGNAESQVVASASNTADWQKQTFIFDSGDYTKFMMAFRWLMATAQIDKVELRQLFDAKADAVADGVAKAMLAAETVKSSNTSFPLLNDELSSTLATVSGNDDNALYVVESAIGNFLQALNDKASVDSLLAVAEKVDMMQFPGQQKLIDAVAAAKEAATAQAISASKNLLAEALNDFLPVENAETQPVQPSFASSNGWEVKVGTYKGGDQRTNTVKGKTCWNAWWSGINASQGENMNMAVRQKVTGLQEGLYSLECKATTEHYCLSDQHGYIACGNETVVTPNLKNDYFDLPTIGNIWQTMATAPVYVEQGGEITIGFIGSKQGAVDNAWHSFGNASNLGDKREGWWCATDFVLKYHPLHKQTVNANEWRTVCLPYAYDVPEGANFFTVAGVLSDMKKICLQPITRVEAGQPCIFIADAENLVYYQYGEKVKSPLNYGTQNNLRGFFETSARAPINSYVLNNGVWVKVESERPVIESYTAILYRLDGMTVLDTWEGVTMDLVDAEGILDIQNNMKAPDGFYTIGGQRTENPKGIYIEVKDNQAIKRIK